MKNAQFDFDVRVPGNASRLFSSREDALIQPSGQVQLELALDGTHIINRKFNPRLIQYDKNYLTTSLDMNLSSKTPTISYFLDKVLPQFKLQPKVVDIGAGQGEFVHELIREGISATGFDTVARKASSVLVAENWYPGKTRADLFVMRCVLPHIPEPFNFLDAIFDANSSAKILIEYQSLIWIAVNDSWNQIHHDHVNIFSLDSFENRYEVMDHGTFSDGEWEWVLVGKRSALGTALHAPEKTEKLDPRMFSNLMSSRTKSIEIVRNLGKPTIIWGAAGKGSVLAHALTHEAPASFSAEVRCVDVDPLKHRKFLEVSGVEVISPKEVFDQQYEDNLVLVSNPRHLSEVSAFLGSSRNVFSIQSMIHQFST